jgi:DNA-binding response OmpR family regulator
MARRFSGPYELLEDSTGFERGMMPTKRVMIIEDDPDTIDLVKVILQLQGYEAVSALGGKMGLRLLHEAKADLILLDLMMDDMDGWTVLEMIKADDDLCSIPVIILSVKHRLEDLRRAKAHAGQYAGYVVKPFNVRTLLEKIVAVLEGEGSVLEPD